MEPRSIIIISLLAAVSVMWGCSSESSPDANPTASSSSSETESPDISPAPPLEPSPPEFASWTPPVCGPGEMPSIGEATCRLVGSPCPEDGWPEQPEGEGQIRYVAVGGTGSGLSPDAPAGSIQQAADSMSSPGTVLLKAGRYEETLTITTPAHIIGACPQLTTIASTIPSITAGTIELTQSAAGLSNLRVTGPRPGIWVWEHKGHAKIQNVVVEQAAYVGISFTNVNNQATLEDVLVRDIQADIEGGYGWGIELFDSVSVALSRVAIESTLDAGIYADGDALEIDAEDLIVARIESNPTTLSGGWGLALFSGATMSLKRGYLYQTRGMGILIQEAGASFSGEDTVIREVYEDSSDLSWGRGISVRNGAQLMLNRALITDTRDLGIGIIDEESHGFLTDVVVSNTLYQLSDNTGGWALSVLNGARVSAERIRLENSQDVALLVDASGSHITASDLTIHGTRENPDGLGGWGLGVQLGGSAALERAVIEDNREVGVVIFDESSELQAEDLVVRGTQGCLCGLGENPECPDAYGDGIELLGGASFEVNRFEITDNARVGLAILDPTQVSSDSNWGVSGTPSLNARHGLITTNLIGLNLEGESINLERDFTNVLNYDNLEVDLATSTLAMPGPSDASSITDQD